VDDLDAARPSAELCRTDTDEPLAEGGAVRRHQLHRVTRPELAVAGDDPHGEQAPSILDERAVSAPVHDEAAGDRLRVTQPQLEGARTASLLRDEARAAALARNDGHEHVPAASGRDRRRHPGGRGEPRGGDLARHSATTQVARRADHRFVRRFAVGQQLRPRGRGMLAVDAVHLCQQDQETRARQHGDLGRERIVVAEGDLVRGRGVVLVHDRHDTQLQQSLERVARVDIARPLGEVQRGEEDLPGFEALRTQCGSPRRLQPRLADRRRRLQPRRRVWTSRQAQSRHPERDRSGRHDADVLAGADERSDLGGVRGELRAPHPTAPVDDERGAELDDDRHRCWLPSPTTRYCLNQRSR